MELKMELFNMMQNTQKDGSYDLVVLWILRQK